MSTRRTIRACRSAESGYALLMVVFMAAAVLIATAAATPSLLQQGTREKEEELIWRGQQYARAVRLYYRKYGRFPQSVEDLTKAKNQIRFLRRTYTDPMNSADGTWRMIYITPTGQLVGSLKRRGQIQLPGAQPAAGAAQPGQRPGTPPPGAQQSQQPAPGAPNQPNQPTPAAPNQPNQPTPAAPNQPNQPAAPEASGPGVEGKIFGGNIIGVGSKINRSSVHIYDGSANYREWEFFWDPSKGAIVVGQPVAPGGTPVNPAQQGQPAQQQQQQQQLQQQLQPLTLPQNPPQPPPQ